MVNIFPSRVLPPITFIDDDFSINDPGQDDLVFISTTIANW